MSTALRGNKGDRAMKRVSCFRFCLLVLVIAMAVTFVSGQHVAAAVLYDWGNDEFGVVHFLFVDLPDPIGGTYEPVRGPLNAPLGYNRWLPKAEVNFVKLWAAGVWINVDPGPASGDVTDYGWATPGNPNDPRMTYRAWRNSFFWLSVNWQIYVDPAPPKAPAYVGIDTSPPVTTLSVGATPAPKAGWYETDAVITLGAADEGGSGVTTEYRLGQAARSEYSVPFPVTGEGIHQIYFGSVDGAGNIEAGGEHLYDLQIDYNPPEFIDLPQDGRFHYFYDWARSSFAFTVSGKSGDSLASPDDLTVLVSKMSGNISDYVITDPTGAEGDFSVEFLVSDPGKSAEVTLRLEDPSGHFATYEARVPEPLSFILFAAGLGGLLGFRRTEAGGQP